MRWNCPHCNTALSLADEKLTNKWSYSKCFQCSGFSLVRKSELNMIKVDRGPATLAKKPAPLVTAPQLHAPEIRETETRAPGAVSNAFSKLVAIGIASSFLIAIGSGFYLYRQGKDLWVKARTVSNPARVSAMPQPPVNQAIAQAITQVDRKANSASHPDLVSDELREKAMAPSRSLEGPPIHGEAPSSSLPPPQPRMMVQVRLKSVLLRSGPGTEFQSLGTAHVDTLYAVTDFRDRWFKILLPVESQNQTAWIRNDLVQLVSK